MPHTQSDSFCFSFLLRMCLLRLTAVVSLVARLQLHTSLHVHGALCKHKYHTLQQLRSVLRAAFFPAAYVVTLLLNYCLFD